MTMPSLPDHRDQAADTPRQHPEQLERPYATLWIADREILLFEGGEDRAYFLSA